MTTLSTPTPMSPAKTEDHRGLANLSRYLRAAGVSFTVVEHALTYTARDEARATMAQPSHVAKTVALKDATGYVFVSVPATERVDVTLLRHLLGRDGLRLAMEGEMAADLHPFELGALPPVGPLADASEVIDERLLGGLVLASAGDHLHSVIVDPDDLVRRTGAMVADVCERP